MSYPDFSVAIAVKNAALAIEFYKAAFGAEERFRLIDPQTGGIGHAEILVKGALVMLADEYPAFNTTPETLGGTSAKLCLICYDLDAEFDCAVAAGAEIIRPLTDQFYGHRTGCLRDPFGHEWTLSKEVEAVTPEEMQRRWDAMSAGEGRE